MYSSSKLIRREQCPSCAKEGGDNHEDNLAVYDDGHSFCFKCNYYQPNKDYALEDFTYEFLPYRGITKGTMEHYNCKTKVAADGSPVSLGFLYPFGSVKVRKVQDKEFYWAGVHKPGLFGTSLFAAGSDKVVTITEGEYDALSYWQVLRTPVVSVQSASSALRDCKSDYAWLNSFERIYLAFDNDAAGREAAGRVAKLFDPNKVFQVKFSNRKDANEYLQLGEGEELRNIWHNSKRYLPENIISTFSDFRNVLKTPTAPSVPYPFKPLNTMTYGMRTSESVLITAQEGVGKTELMHAILYQLLEHTDDNVACFFIEEPPKDLLRAIGGIKIQAPVHLPGSPYTDDDIATAVEEVLRKDERLFIYSHFGSDDPDVLIDSIRYLVSVCGCRRVLIDHITMAVTGLAGEKDERRALDYLTSRLEMMVVELDFSLIWVSHVNDFNQTRGSRNAAKVSNTIIHCTRDVANGSDIIQLTVIKNRFGQKTGPAGSYRFDPVKRLYLETTGDNDNGYLDHKAA
jgi:twinkle protein